MSSIAAKQPPAESTRLMHSREPHVDAIFNHAKDKVNNSEPMKQAKCLDTNSPAPEAQPRRSRQEYVHLLEQFDIAVCDALAVSQASSGRIVAPHHGYGTQVFTVICTQAIAMVRAAPLSRWTRSDFQHWSPSALAAYARAIVEGHLLLAYLMEETESSGAWLAKLQIMHLNDCTRRITLFTNLGVQEQVQGFEEESKKLQSKLAENSYFQTLPPHIKKRCLQGDSPTIDTRQELLDRVGWDRQAFRAIFDLWSQHSHILTLSFYRLEPNGRGTGLENDSDRSSMATMLEICSNALSKCTDIMVDAFPDTKTSRNGKKSKFSPGPRGNSPR